MPDRVVNLRMTITQARSLRVAVSARLAALAAASESSPAVRTRVSYDLSTMRDLRDSLDLLLLDHSPKGNR